MFDFTTLTGNEVATIEDLSGLSLDSIGNADSPKAKLLGAIIFIAKRREGEKSVTFNSVMAMTITEMTDYLGLNEEAPDEDSEEGKEDSSVVPAKKSKRPSSSTPE